MTIKCHVRTMYVARATTNWFVKKTGKMLLKIINARHFQTDTSALRQKNPPRYTQILHRQNEMHFSIIYKSRFLQTLNVHSTALKQSDVWLLLAAASHRPGPCCSLQLPPALVWYMHPASNDNQRKCHTLHTTTFYKYNTLWSEKYPRHINVTKRIVLSEIHLRTTGCHLSIGSHSVICHQTEVTAPAGLHLNRAGWYST